MTLPCEQTVSLSFSGYGPTLSIPFSDCSINSMSSATSFAARAGSPMPRFTYGHELVGLARSEPSANRLAQAGGRPVRGSLADTDLLAEQAAAADGVVQITTGGFLTQALETVDESVQATRTLLDALADGKVYLWTLGVGAWMDTGSLQPDRVVTEADPMTPPYFYAHLRDIQHSILAEQRLRTVVIAPGQVYGGDGGYIGPIARLFNGLRRHGVVYAVAPGDNAFTFVHIDDLADL
jgi:nucleoside-diphosphate-sugar epimerase